MVLDFKKTNKNHWQVIDIEQLRSTKKIYNRGKTGFDGENLAYA